MSQNVDENEEYEQNNKELKQNTSLINFNHQPHAGIETGIEPNESICLEVNKKESNKNKLSNIKFDETKLKDSVSSFPNPITIDTGLFL
jgi:hypothetical protein